MSLEVGVSKLISTFYYFKENSTVNLFIYALIALKSNQSLTLWMHNTDRSTKEMILPTSNTIYRDLNEESKMPEKQYKQLALVNLSIQQGR